MESYVGIDAHCNAGLELAAIEARSGELLWRDRCRLDGDLLREAIGLICPMCLGHLLTH